MNKLYFPTSAQRLTDFIGEAINKDLNIQVKHANPLEDLTYSWKSFTLIYSDPYCLHIYGKGSYDTQGNPGEAGHSDIVELELVPDWRRSNGNN